jgi:hypothetical protein
VYIGKRRSVAFCLEGRYIYLPTEHSTAERCT